MRIATAEEIAALEQLAVELRAIELDLELESAENVAFVAFAANRGSALPQSLPRADLGDKRLDWSRRPGTSGDRSRPKYPS
jgi:hypothetical protein